VRILVFLVLPFVSAASETDALIDLARVVPAEFAADALIRISALEQTPKAKKLDLLQEAYQAAGGAQHPYKLQSAVTSQGGAAAFLHRAYQQDLDGLTLRLRAIEAMVPLDGRKAAELFEQIPPLKLPATGCAQNQAYDVSLFYSVLGSVAGHARARFVDSYMAAIASPAQVGPAAKMLARAALDNDGFRTAVTAFAGALRRVEADDRSFTWSAGSGADMASLVEACRNRGVPALLVVEAYRHYLVSHLAGERCADNPLMQSNSPNIGTGIVNQPIADTGSADAVKLFNEKLRVPPVKEIARYETYPSKTEGTAATGGSCDDAGCQAVRDGYRKLLFNAVGVAYTADDRAKPEWRDRLPALLDALAAWKDADAADRIASFAAKCSFYSDLAGMVVLPADRDTIYHALLDFLARSSLRDSNRMEWFLPLNVLIGRAAMYPAGYGRLIDEMENSGDPIAALYARLEKLAPRPPGRIMLLL
jgi:hypothetical protein